MNSEMKKNDVVKVEVTTLSGRTVEITAVVIDTISVVISDHCTELIYILYGQNRLFKMRSTVITDYGRDIYGDVYEEEHISTPKYDGVLYEYLVIHKLDKQLKNYCNE